MRLNRFAAVTLAVTVAVSATGCGADDDDMVAQQPQREYLQICANTPAEVAMDDDYCEDWEANYDPSNATWVYAPLVNGLFNSVNYYPEGSSIEGANYTTTRPTDGIIYTPDQVEDQMEDSGHSHSAAPLVVIGSLPSHLKNKVKVSKPTTRATTKATPKPVAPKTQAPAPKTQAPAPKKQEVAPAPQKKSSVSRGGFGSSKSSSRSRSRR